VGPGEGRVGAGRVGAGEAGADRKGRSADVKVSHVSSSWVRRGILAAILVGVVLFPGHTAGVASRSCRTGECPRDGSVRWSRQLTGSWIAENGTAGTAYSRGQAYVAVGGNVAVVGYGLSVDAYDADNGFPRWTATLTGLPAGSAIISVRAWPGVVTVGMTVTSSGSGAPGASPAPRDEIVLDAVTGKRIRVYPAAEYGGAVSASARRTVIVGTDAVTSYDNKTGAAIWRDPIGAVPQAWRLDGASLYVTISAHGVLGTAPVTAVRQINVRTGAERLIRPPRGPFAGTFSGVADGFLLFSGSAGLTGYSMVTGLPWLRPDAVFEGADPVQQVIYVDIAGALVGIDPGTGRNERGATVPGPTGTYGVRDGVALGLDHGAAGAAWGYSIARRRVIWTTQPLPWPHYFVDLSGIGGSADPASDTVLLTTCARVGAAVPAGVVTGAGLVCLRPMLVAIER